MTLRTDNSTGLNTISPDTHTARDSTHFRTIAAANRLFGKAKAGLNEARRKARAAGY